MSASKPAGAADPVKVHIYDFDTRTYSDYQPPAGAWRIGPEIVWTQGVLETEEEILDLARDLAACYRTSTCSSGANLAVRPSDNGTSR